MAKKLLVLLTVCVLLIPLTACGNGTANNTNSPTAPLQSRQTTDVTEPTQEESITPQNTGGKEMKSLVVYFSWSGNTRAVAEEIQRQTNAQIFEIVPESPYTDDYNALLDIAKAQQRNNARPAFAGGIENLSEYDVVYLGFPNWWADMPMIVYTFLDEYDLSDKTVAPFCTSGGSGFSNTISAIKSAEPDATVLEGLHVRDGGTSKSGKAVSDWLSKA
jgi:flavodoxin